MDATTYTRREPVRLLSLITSAVLATIALLALCGVSEEVVAALSGVAVAWIAVAGEVVRSRVTPVE